MGQGQVRGPWWAPHMAKDVPLYALSTLATHHHWPGVQPGSLGSPGPPRAADRSGQQALSAGGPAALTAAELKLGSSSPGWVIRGGSASVPTLGRLLPIGPRAGVSNPIAPHHLAKTLVMMSDSEGGLFDCFTGDTGDSPVLYEVLSGIPGLYLLNARSIPCPAVTLRNVYGYGQMTWGHITPG